MSRPDPILSANLYASGRLDGVLYRVVAPVWWRLGPGGTGGGADGEAGREAYLWVMRYARGGEHLKIRLHGEQALVPAFRRGLEETAGAYFATLGETAEDEPRASRPDAPPIDAEDTANDDDAPRDRSLCWTRWRRSPVSLGGSPWIGDDTYVGLLTRCLAHGTDLLLEQEPEGDELPHRLRQSTLLKGLILGLADLGFSARQRTAYLTYHRDWLIRYPVLKRQAPPERLVQLPAQLELQTGQLAVWVEALGAAAKEEWTEGREEATGSAVGDESSSHRGWKRSLAALLGYVERFRDDPEHHLDPYAPDPLFVPLFKVMHGLANQLGLAAVDEALAHHLLLRATGPDGAGSRIELLPEMGDVPLATHEPPEEVSRRE